MIDTRSDARQRCWMIELPWVAARPVIRSDMTIIARLKLHLLSAAILAQAVLNAPAAPVIDVQVDQPGAHINPAMWGVFFEDINIGADGGLVGRAGGQQYLKYVPGAKAR